MCGIAGIVDFSGRPVETAHLERMADALKHRGPDDVGFYCHQEDTVAVGLAHRRLSIIDLSAAGHQPMITEDGSAVVILNGEIYNFRELRAEIAPRNVFRSQSDTEVLLHLYGEEGLDAFGRLDGMFAVAIWDTRHRRLVLARDAFGKKPLFYCHAGDRIAFASELPALLALPDTPRRLASARIGEYLALGFVRNPHTLLEDVRQVPPGSILVLEPGAEPKGRRHFDLPPVAETPMPLAEAVEGVARRLESAVRKRLLAADVPVGAFLSGGMDSSLVVVNMARLAGEPFRTFSVGFENERSELPYAREVAVAVGSVHRELLVRPPHGDAVDDLLRSYGVPFGDSTALAMNVLASAARDHHCKVVLTGDGGDELFAGYRRFVEALDGAQTPVSRGFLRALARPLPPGRLQRALRRRGRTAVDRFIASSAVLDVDFVAALLRPPVPFDPDALAADYQARLRARPDLRGLRAFLALNLETYLADDLLPKTDLMTMAHGVEARCPMLDRDLFTFVWNLPDGLKLGGDGLGKRVLRELGAKLLPPALVARPKQGFSIPMSAWLREEWRELGEEAFSARSSLRDYLDGDGVSRLWRSHLDGEDWGPSLWSLLVLERWLRRLRA